MQQDFDPLLLCDIQDEITELRIWARRMPNKPVSAADLSRLEVRLDRVDATLAKIRGDAGPASREGC